MLSSIFVFKSIIEIKWKKWRDWISFYKIIGSFIKRQTSGTSSDNEWQRVTTSDTTSDNEWQQATTKGKEWYNEWQRVVQRMTTSDSERQRVTTNDNEWYKEWQRVTISVNFSFFQIRGEPTTKHPRENSLNLNEDLRRRPIELRAERSP